jgi:hypothetical protein
MHGLILTLGVIVMATLPVVVAEILRRSNERREQETPGFPVVLRSDQERP